MSMTTVTLRIKEIALADGIQGPGELKEFLGISRSMADRLWDSTTLPRMDKLAAYAKKFGRPMADLYNEESTVIPRRRKRSQKNGHKPKAR